MNIAGQRVWVIGAGLLGRALSSRCAAAGAAVVMIDIDPAVAPHVCGDSADPATYARARQCSGGLPAVVFCCPATHGGTVADYRHCYVGTAQALSNLGLAGRCVFCSSTSVYGTPTERTAALSEAERLIGCAGGSVARLVPIYGRGRCELLRRHLAGEPRLPGEANRVLNYVHVDDAAAALLLLAERECSGYCDVCGESFTKARAYEWLAELTGIPAAGADAPPSHRSATTAAIIPHTLRELGWVPQQLFADFVREQLRG